MNAFDNNNNDIKEVIDIDKIAQTIWNDLFSLARLAICPECHYENKPQITRTIKCEACGFNFINKVQQISFQISDDKIQKLIICMLRDFTIEETMKFINSNAETIRKNWVKLYDYIDWNRYNVKVREEPIKRIYSSFEVILN